MNCISPQSIWPHRSIEWCDKNEEYPVTVPCGKCLPCLMKKRRDWTFRLEQEYKYSSNAFFVTLTYDRVHLRSNESLCKRDVQLYLKRLRKPLRVGIRYFAVGEYGTKGGRPHYHLLLFNVNSEDPEKSIRSAWVDSKGKPIGMVHIGRVEEKSISYCTKYIVQPQGEFPDGMQKPFSLMSRGYGIGGRYLTDDVVEWHRRNGAVFAYRYNEKVPLPRFYKSKIWYDADAREKVSKGAMLQALKQQELARKTFEKLYGSRAVEKMTEFRDAVLARVKTKVAFTQKL